MSQRFSLNRFDAWNEDLFQARHMSAQANLHHHVQPTVNTLPREDPVIDSEPAQATILGAPPVDAEGLERAHLKAIADAHNARKAQKRKAAAEAEAAAQAKQAEAAKDASRRAAIDADPDSSDDERRATEAKKARKNTLANFLQPRCREGYHRMSATTMAAWEWICVYCSHKSGWRVIQCYCPHCEYQPVRCPRYYN